MSDKTFAAAIWVIGGKLLARMFDFVALLVLARLLLPADFGLVAMAMTVVLIAESVLELPLVQALIRIAKPTRAMFDTALTLSLLRGAALAVFLIGCSWPIAYFYAEPRLVVLISALSLAPILRGLTSPRMVVYIQQMDFRPEFVIELAGKSVALVISSSIAFETGSYWAIAVGTISSPMVACFLSYVAAPHNPRLGLSEWSRFSDMVGWNSASQLMAAINWQLDRLLLGRFVSQTEFGKFALASDISGIAIQALVVPIARPLVAAFAPLNEKVALGEAYCKASNAILLIAGPVFLIIALLSEPIVRLVLGEYWLEAAPILAWLSAITFLSLPVAPMASLAMSMDRARVVTVRTATELAVKLPTTIIGIVTLGIPGALIARAAIGVVIFAVSMVSVRQLVGLRVRQQLIAIWRTSAALCAMLLALLALRSLGEKVVHPLELAVFLCFNAGVAALVYAVMIVSLWRISGCPAGVEEIALRRLGSIGRRLLK